MKFMSKIATSAGKDLSKQDQHKLLEEERQLEKELEKRQLVNGSTDNLGRPVI